ncbi:hypothetical protein V6N13_049239 [Hibiscus sabdariffa]
MRFPIQQSLSYPFSASSDSSQQFARQHCQDLSSPKQVVTGEIQEQSAGGSATLPAHVETNVEASNLDLETNVEAIDADSLLSSRSDQHTSQDDGVASAMTNSPAEILNLDHSSTENNTADPVSFNHSSAENNSADPVSLQPSLTENTSLDGAATSND